MDPEALPLQPKTSLTGDRENNSRDSNAAVPFNLEYFLFTGKAIISRVGGAENQLALEISLVHLEITVGETSLPNLLPRFLSLKRRIKGFRAVCPAESNVAPLVIYQPGTGGKT